MLPSFDFFASLLTHLRQAAPGTRCADWGLNAAHTASSVSKYGPPIRSMQ